MAGAWSVDDLTALMRIILLNRNVFGQMDSGLARLKAPFYRFIPPASEGTPDRGSRHNIAAHYDLGNDFYALFLDDTLTYSCGIFESEDSTLKEASLAKYDRICRKLVFRRGSRAGDRQRLGRLCHPRREPLRLPGDHHHHFPVPVRPGEGENPAAGAGDRVEILLKDYRDLSGTYDKLVSIEMIEAVGYEYLDTFFRACDRL